MHWETSYDRYGKIGLRLPAKVGRVSGPGKPISEPDLARGKEASPRLLNWSSLGKTILWFKSEPV